MARYIATLRLTLDTQRDGRRAAEFILEDVVHQAKGWIGTVKVEWRLDDAPEGVLTPLSAPVEEPDAKPADPPSAGGPTPT